MMQPKGKAKDIAMNLLGKTKAEQRRRDKPDKLREKLVENRVPAYGSRRYGL